MPLTIRRVLIVCLLAVLTTPVAARRQDGGPRFVWTGTATVSDLFEPARAFDPTEWSGGVRDDRTVQLRVKEARHVDVTDGTGRLIGQIVHLEDDGSTWAGTVQHNEVHLGSVHITGAGSGSGRAIVTGVIYRSAVTPNPVADVVKDGAYWLMASLDSEIKYTQRITEEGRRPEISDMSSVSALHAGDGRLAYWLAMVPTPATEADLRAAFGRPPPAGVVVLDAPRLLTGERMAGGYSKEGTGDARGTLLTAEWSLTRTSNVRVTLSEVDASWRPEWLGTTTITATVDPAINVKGRFRFTLYDVSREPGRAMNSDSGTNPDLKFADAQPQATNLPVATADGWTTETTAESTSASVTVQADDYGAWGRLKAEVFVGGAWVTAVTARGGDFASVPLDDNNDHIADRWLDDAGIPGHAASEDADSGPEGANTGDGYSNYEEYRGFFSQGSWLSTDPTWKELFVNNEATADECGSFTSTGIVCVMINADEYDANRVVNFNRHNATAGPQKGLLVLSGSLTTAPDGSERVGVLGETMLAVPNEGSPIILDLSYIAFFNRLGVTDEGAITPIIEARSSVLAHEMGHAVNIDHHGTNDSGTACSSSSIIGAVSVWGGAYSGDRACFMSYARPQQYQRPDGSCHEWVWPHQWGHAICSTKGGTGLNAGPERMENGKPLPAAGDATNGDCKHQLRLKR